MSNINRRSSIGAGEVRHLGLLSQQGNNCHYNFLVGLFVLFTWSCFTSRPPLSWSLESCTFSVPEYKVEINSLGFGLGNPLQNIRMI